MCAHRAALLAIGKDNKSLSLSLSFSLIWAIKRVCFSVA